MIHGFYNMMRLYTTNVYSLFRNISQFVTVPKSVAAVAENKLKKSIEMVSRWRVERRIYDGIGESRVVHISQGRGIGLRL